MQNNVADRLSCPQCGRIVRWNDAYCSACGVKLEQGEAKPIRLPALNSSISRSELWGIKPKAKSDVETDAQDLPSHSPLVREDEEQTDADSSLLQEDDRLDADSSPLQEDDRSDADSSPLQEDDRSDAGSSPLQEDDRSDADSSLLQEDDRSDADSSPLQEDDRSDADSSPLQEDDRSDDEQNRKNDVRVSKKRSGKTRLKYSYNYPKLSFGLFVLLLLELFAFIPYVFVVLCVFKYNVFCDVLAISGTVVLFTHGVCVCASYVVALVHASKNKYEETMKDMDIFRRLLSAGAILFSAFLLAFVICLVCNDSSALPPKAEDEYTPVSFDD